jgi:hypothetical protein
LQFDPEFLRLNLFMDAWLLDQLLLHVPTMPPAFCRPLPNRPFVIPQCRNHRLNPTAMPDSGHDQFHLPFVGTFPVKDRALSG